MSSLKGASKEDGQNKGRLNVRAMNHCIHNAPLK